MKPHASPELAAVLLADVGRLGRRGRGLLRQFWFPLVLFGLLEIGSAPLTGAAGGTALGVYWLIAGPLGGLACFWYYQRRERLTGFGWVHARAYAALGGALFVSAWLVGVFAPGAWHTAGPIACVGGAYCGFAMLERSSLLGAFAVGLVVTGGWLGVSGLVTDARPGTVAVGAATILVGLAYRVQSRRLAREW